MTLRDLNGLENEDIFEAPFDVCIVGAGAAGITIAIELGKAGLRVALCEAGGTEYSDESQDCYLGTVEGDPYRDELESTRLRYFGGTTNHWSGMCRSFDAIDFERGYLGKEYEWPINIEAISPYRRRACDILDVNDDFEPQSNKNGNVRKIKFQFSPPTRFSEKFLPDLTRSNNIFTITNANLVDLHGENGRIHSASFQNYQRRIFKIAARRFVFAMGGIENSRFLLWFKHRHGRRFFDSEIPIGQYWMEHPHFTLGNAIVESNIADHAYYTMSDDAQVSAGILNCGFRIEKQRYSETKELVRDLICVAPTLGLWVADLAGKNLVCGVWFRAAWEQAPVASNAVTLDKEKDRFGIPRVVLKWRKREIDRKTIKESVRIFNAWLMDREYGRVQLQDWLAQDRDYPSNDELIGPHHMGGTRMSASATYGVVDRDCKVFGSQNLYMAGSSVFTTGGHNNPTLPIVQFSLRLADHLITLSTPG